MNIKIYGFVLIVTASICFKGIAQKTIALKKENLVAMNRTVSVQDSNGKAIVYLDAHAGNGIAWIKNIRFDTGEIELDIKGKDVLQQSFVGIVFHGINDNSYDAVYFRPFNFNSTDSLRKKHAVQYISMPQYDFAALRQSAAGIYENKLTSHLEAENWFHAKIVVKTGAIIVFINHDKVPCLTVSCLNHYREGNLGFWVGHNSDGSFASLAIKQ